MRVGWDYSHEYGPCHQRLYLPEGSLRVTVENCSHITMYPWGEKLILKTVSKSPSFSADLGTFWRTSSLGYHISQGVLVHFYCKERLTWAKYFLTLQLTSLSHIHFETGAQPWVFRVGRIFPLRNYPLSLRNKVSGNPTRTGHHTPQPPDNVNQTSGEYLNKSGEIGFSLPGIWTRDLN